MLTLILSFANKSLTISTFSFSTAANNAVFLLVVFLTPLKN